jgi:hypothetical protein
MRERLELMRQQNMKHAEMMWYMNPPGLKTRLGVVTPAGVVYTMRFSETPPSMEKPQDESVEKSKKSANA